MSKYKDVDMLAAEMKSKIYQLRDKTLDALNKETAKAVDSAMKEFGVYQQQKITQIFNSAVQEFYDAYTPKEYNRTYGLYDVLDLKTDSHGMVITSANGYLDLFDSSSLHGDRSGGDLFQKVFMEGWHGGAESIASGKAAVWGSHPSPGTPYYRRSGFVTYPNSTTKKWHKYGKWGRVAVRTESPYKIIEERLSAAEQAEMFAKFDEVVRKHNDRAVEKVKQSIKTFQTEIYG